MNRRRLFVANVFVPFVASAFVGLVAAQTFRSDVTTVPVTVTVTDAQGRLVTGLSRDDFEVYEEGVRQRVTQFTDARVPVSLGMMLDASDSMRGQPIVDARNAVDRFLGELLDPGDEAFVATFNHSTRLVAVWTKPPSTLRHALDAVRPSGGTAIYDALAAASPMFERRAHTRAAFVLVSDGADTASDRTLLQALDVVRTSDAVVYAIGIDSVDAQASTRVNPQALRDITGLSGGYTEIVHSAADLGPATERIAHELNTQYTIGYSPARSPDSRWRAIRVRARQGGYSVRARRGYFATPD